MKLLKISKKTLMSASKAEVVNKITSYFAEVETVQLAGIRVNLKDGASIEGIAVVRTEDWEDKTQPCPAYIILKNGGHAQLWAQAKELFDIEKSEVIETKE